MQHLTVRLHRFQAVEPDPGQPVRDPQGESAARAQLEGVLGACGGGDEP